VTVYSAPVYVFVAEVGKKEEVHIEGTSRRRGRGGSGGLKVFLHWGKETSLSPEGTLRRASRTGLRKSSIEVGPFRKGEKRL